MNKSSSVRVAIVGTVGVPANYGGFETLAENLIGYSESITYQVYCSKKNYTLTQSTYKGARLIYLPMQANGMQSVIYDFLSIIHALFTANTLLILGVSGCMFLPFLRLFFRKRIIINIDGLEHKRDKWGGIVRWFLKLSERMAVRYADVVIADNLIIQEYIKLTYGKQSELIEYGGNHVLKVKPDLTFLAELGLNDSLYAFSVCRIEPENNIHMILEAFSQTQYQIVVVGNWEKSNYGRRLRDRYAQYKNIVMLSPIYDLSRLNALRVKCQYYVHGHSAGGTNPSLVEAMSLRLPIIAFDVAYNRETTENKAVYFTSINSLIKKITNLNDVNLNNIANEMFMVAEKRYQWDVIVQKYHKLLTS